MRTVHIAPDSIFVAISADFEDVMMMGEGEALIEEIEAELKQASPRISSTGKRSSTTALTSGRNRIRCSAFGSMADPLS